MEQRNVAVHRDAVHAEFQESVEHVRSSAAKAVQDKTQLMEANAHSQLSKMESEMQYRYNLALEGMQQSTSVAMKRWQDELRESQANLARSEGKCAGLAQQQQEHQARNLSQSQDYAKLWDEHKEMQAALSRSATEQSSSFAAAASENQVLRSSLVNAESQLGATLANCHELQQRLGATQVSHQDLERKLGATQASNQEMIRDFQKNQLDMMNQMKSQQEALQEEWKKERQHLLDIMRAQNAVSTPPRPLKPAPPLPEHVAGQSSAAAAPCGEYDSPNSPSRPTAACAGDPPDRPPAWTQNTHSSYGNPRPHVQEEQWLPGTGNHQFYHQPSGVSGGRPPLAQNLKKKKTRS